MKSCPVCKVSLTALLLEGGVEVDVCPACSGLWFDHAEVEKVHHGDAALNASITLHHANPAPLLCRQCGSFNPRRNKKCTLCGAEVALRCIHCDLLLEEVTVGSLTIDRCNKCRGVWLDGGELSSLFKEFQQLRAMQNDQKKLPAGLSRQDALETAGDLTLTTLIWAPELFVYGGLAVAEAAKHLPGLIGRGMEGAVDLAGQAPEIAGKAVELSSGAISGAIDLAGEVPEAASAVFEIIASFIASILEALSD